MLTQPMHLPGWTISLCACILMLPQHRGVAQATDSARTAPLTTFSGVYSAAQARQGRAVYLASCASCHTPSELTGGTFWTGLVGKSLADLFGYLRDNMPKDNPVSLSDEDYSSVTAYVLQLNAMPAGERELPADSTALARIRITPADTIKNRTMP